MTVETHLTTQRRPRIVIIGTRGYPSYYGGFETAVRKLAPHLIDRGWDVVVYGRDGATKQDDPGADPRVRSITTRGLESKSLSTLSYGLTATLHAVRNKPDVALVMNVANGFFLPLLRMRGVRSLVNVDGIEWDRAKWNWLGKAVFKIGARFTAKFADRIVADSHEIGRRWRADFGRDSVYIPYGGDSTAEEVAPEFPHRGYVLVVARFVPENTIPEFLAASSRIALVMPVVIVGSSGYGGELDDLAAQLDRDNDDVHWLGHVSDDRRLHALWRHAAVYFHGHSVGGTNPTLVQAMASDVPIVARDTVYNREVLADGGVYCAPTPEAIADTVIELATAPQEQAERRAILAERSRTIFTWTLVNNAYEEAARELLR